jgi:hypothetical protein
MNGIPTQELSMTERLIQKRKFPRKEGVFNQLPHTSLRRSIKETLRMHGNYVIVVGQRGVASHKLIN